MNLNFTQTIATAHTKPGRLYQTITSQPSLTLDEVRVAFLTRRHGLPPARALIIAGLHFGEAKS